MPKPNLVMGVLEQLQTCLRQQLSKLLDGPTRPDILFAIYEEPGMVNAARSRNSVGRLIYSFQDSLTCLFTSILAGYACSGGTSRP